MGSRFINPDPQFLDAKGNPLNGGLVNFYTTGTTTPATTYSDQALTTANANPIVLGSDGRIGNCFLDPSVAYKAVLTDSLGNNPITMDPINNIGSSVVAAFSVYPGNPNANVAGNAGTQGVRGADAVWDTTDNLLFICTTTGTKAGAVWTSVVSALTANEDVVTAATYTVAVGDAGRIKTANNATGSTFTLTASSTIGANKMFGIKNIGAGPLTLTPSGTDKIEGQTTWSLINGEGIILYSTGSGWRILASEFLGSSAPEVTVASAATCNILGAASEFIAISGTTTVTSFGTGINRKRFVRATGAFIITQNATSLICPGAASILTQAGDTFIVVSDASSNARIESYVRSATTTDGPPRPPDGRLTLTSGTPVLTADVAAATTVYWALYGGSGYPWFDGTGWTRRTIAELSLALDSNAGHTGYHQSGKVFDFFLYNNAGTDVLATSPAWTNDTTRSALLAQINGVWTNAASMTARSGTAAATLTIGINQGTYVGTMRATADGQTAMVMNPAGASGGAIATLGLWNLYNRVLTFTFNLDNGAPYTYTTGTVRQARASASNQNNFVTGLALDAIYTEIGYNTNSTSAAGSNGTMGIGLDSTTAFYKGMNSLVYTVAAAVMSGQGTAPALVEKQIGYHYIAKLELGDGSHACTFNVNSIDCLKIGVMC